MRTPARITILGYDGTGDPPDIGDIWRDRVIPELRAQHPDFRASDLNVERHPMRKRGVDRVMEYLHGWFIAKEHNETVPALTRYMQVSRLATAAVSDTACLYGDLARNTTINWLAAHHTFVIATIQARRLLTERAELAQALAARKESAGVCGLHRPGSLTRLYYDAHVPADQQITLPDPDTDHLAIAEFVELSTERFRILRATITGTYPPGFEPTPIDPAAAADQVAAEWAGNPIPISPALVYADRGSRR